jgi:hypothetical protein
MYDTLPLPSTVAAALEQGRLRKRQRRLMSYPLVIRLFGCTGTAAREGDGSAPFSQVRIVAVTARAGHAMLGAILEGSRAGEQTLLACLVRRRPDLVTGRVICFDRNFPGYDLISAIVNAGGHIVSR